MAFEAVALLPSAGNCPAGAQAPARCSFPLSKLSKPRSSGSSLHRGCFLLPYLSHRSSTSPAAGPSTTAQESVPAFSEGEEEEGHALGLPSFNPYDTHDEYGDDENGYPVDIDHEHYPNIDDRGGNGGLASYTIADNGSFASHTLADTGRPKVDIQPEIKPIEDIDRFKIQHGREVFVERTYLVGIERKGSASLFGITDSLEELAQLADTAGLNVVGSTYQKLDHPNPRTYIGSGKVAELRTEVRALDVETVIFDDELSPGQLRNLEKALGNEVRVCDRTALILDIFSQRAATREATLQVELAQMEYQLPRLTKMWSHLERQAGGMVKGMGEKQIEVDKRIIRSRIALLRKELDSVRGHRQQYRDRRGSVPIPVVSLVGYTNAGKSTLLNRLSGAGVLAEDRLFATLDPTTRKIELPNGNQCLLTDTVGFIQKLPTQLVASFRATLEEINDSSLIVHVVDISHPLCKEQMGAVDNVLADLNVGHIPKLVVWNKIDRTSFNISEVDDTSNVVRISALTGDGIDAFCKAIQDKLKDSMVWVDVLVPYDKGEFVDSVHRLGVVESMEYVEDGIALRAHVPLRLSQQLQPMRQAMD
ncbi:hypothetical protein KP509_34G037600 [Ceratopteris richardii]|uniref:Hflx-type G domain-containing protein n=1 Tax=Ceratopteris richardii TaxID=49495 RepID=A0A8T2QKA4_CERRI|nr:hypothetical protein KP509_34G037600 [Ceratopteris richardii]KAH7284045.1 hypothetical protein KP509_34G037600 [Ceratopteris richardii]KAH7284046.1 hypothetical protein KP509_34G037600 [Ceratopteris richardii]